MGVSLTDQNKRKQNTITSSETKSQNRTRNMLHCIKLLLSFILITKRQPHANQRSSQKQVTLQVSFQVDVTLAIPFCPKPFFFKMSESESSYDRSLKKILAAVPLRMMLQSILNLTAMMVWKNYKLAQKEVNLGFKFNLIQFVSKIPAKSRRCRWTCSFASALDYLNASFGSSPWLGVQALPEKLVPW